MNKLLEVNCPQCGLRFSYYESASRPFCSERCKLIDLGHWFEETYRVPTKDLVQSEILEEDHETYPIDENDSEYE